jgi:hypothetical protein
MIHPTTQEILMNKRERNMLIVCVVFVAGALWFAFSSSGSTAGKTNLITLEQARSKTAESKANARRLETEQELIEPRVIERAYNKPAEDLVPVLIRDLQATAQRAGIHLREVKPLRPKLVTDEAEIRTLGKTARSTQTTHEILGARVPVEVRFRAQFQPNVVRFLYDIENPAGRMVVDKISITSADAKFKVVEVSAQITVFTRSTTGAAGGDSGDTGDGKTNKG